MISCSINKKFFACSPRHLGFNHLSSMDSGGCVQHCVYVCWCLWLCVRKHFPTNAAHNTYACNITTPIRPSLSPSLPNPKSFISLSLFNKAPIHCPANQSLHSCSQLSMTQFIWPGPCPSHQPSSFFHLFGRATESQITIQCHMQCIGAYKRFLPVATSLRSLSHFTYRPGQIPPCGGSLSDIFL